MQSGLDGDHSWALAVNPLPWQLGCSKEINPMALDSGKLKGGWSWVRPCGVGICRKAFGFISRSLKQPSLSSTCWLIRHWCLSLLQTLATDPSVDTADWVPRKSSHYCIQVGWHITKNWPWNTVTWLMQQSHILCILNNTQGNCQRRLGLYTKIPHQWGTANRWYWPPPSE